MPCPEIEGFHSRNLTQELIIWKFIFLWSFHIRLHYMSSEWKETKKTNKQEIRLRMLIISFPRLIWAASAWSPSRRVFFLASKISTDVLWKTSTISRIFLMCSKGMESTIALRNRSVPILATIGTKKSCNTHDFEDKGLVAQVSYMLRHWILNTHTIVV